MRLLLDTHTLLWFALADPLLSGTATSLIMDPANEKLVSPASYWEIAIKISVKKYALSKPYEVFMQEAIDMNGFGYLHIEPKSYGKVDYLAVSPQRPVRPAAGGSGNGRTHPDHQQ